ncbi:MAG: response regulator [bacterium]|nr:response regulator [bacterium]
MAKRTILVVDDDPNIIQAVSFVLKKEGYIVTTAVDGKEAFKKAKEELPHLIILDVMLPKLSGFEVCKRLKANTQTRKIRTIMLTARSEEKDKRLGEKLGVNAYITKPYNIDEVLFTVKRAIEKKELQRSIEKMKKAALVGYMGEAMSHEIFNPLSVVSGSVQLLMSRIKKGKKLTTKEYEDFFKNITKNVERCIEIINIFRKFYASIGIEIKPRNLEETLRDILEGKI